MIKIKLRPELVPAISDWSLDFDPLAYTWYVEDGRWHDNTEFVDLIAPDAPHGEWLRIRRNLITLADIVNLYDAEDSLSIKSNRYDYDENGKWTFLEGDNYNYTRTGKQIKNQK